MEDRISLEWFEQYIIKNTGLTLVCSRPEFGRFEMLNQLAETTSKVPDTTTLFFSLERPETHYPGFFGYFPGYTIIDKPEITETDIREAVLQYVNVSHIFIDDLQLLPPQLIARLPALAEEFSVHLIGGSQLSRRCADLPRHRPTLSFFEEYVSEKPMKFPPMERIDMLVFLWRPHKCARGIGVASAYSLHSQGDVIIAKNHFGITGDIRVTYQKKRHRFV